MKAKIILVVNYIMYPVFQFSSISPQRNELEISIVMDSFSQDMFELTYVTLTYKLLFSVNIRYETKFQI